eukprot:TRINITY_DN271_c0_g2_i1.p1 TRINITY_DN271_c0_g2~~TRINITY_DN271_c0_g2_i1.p1  ORF type:complete len:419 (-),score=84.93 TRINITY_DN271_c0_g2_i1:143-1399(-)
MGQIFWQKKNINKNNWVLNKNKMPPKKQEVVEKKISWGRPGNTLKMGIIGLPNVGKTSLFNSLTKMQIKIGGNQFQQKEPNKAQVQVPDVRFDNLVKLFKPKKQTRAALNVVDIAGIQSEGQSGLGNQFLSYIQQVDGLYHVVRAFEDEEVLHVEEDINPVRDMEMVYKEFIAKDLDYAEKRIEDLKKQIAKTNDKAAKEQMEIMEKVRMVLSEGHWLRNKDFTFKEIEFLNTHYLLTAKPIIYCINLSEDDFLKKKNKWLGKIAKWVKETCDGVIIPFSASYETKMKEQEMEKGEETKIQEPQDIADAAQPNMINKIIRAGYKALDLTYFFTTGEDEVRCWTIREHSKAPQAGAAIHRDIERGFICVEVIKYEDLLKLGSEAACKAEGKHRQQGKDYVIEDGDCCFFKFNVTKEKKK